MEYLKNYFSFRGSYLSSLGASFWILGRVLASTPAFAPPRVTILRLGNYPLMTLLISELMRLVTHCRTLSSHFAINYGNYSVACPLVLQ
jgi:hypothetical protein